MTRPTLRSLWSLVSGPGPLEDGARAVARAAAMPARAPRPRELAAAEALRAGMLALAADANGIEGVRLRRHIHLAPDLESLWFMRSPLLALLSAAQGEHDAMRRIERISAPARRMLPRSLAGASPRRSMH